MPEVPPVKPPVTVGEFHVYVVPEIAPEGAIEKLSPVQTVCAIFEMIVLLLTETVNLNGSPTQLPVLGVTSYTMS